ncbi:MAG: SsrA-binding protein SmpB [Oscillospiraceae bacterium]|jgi:SsrA-binding protein|nr:SsrA-binding protein SmpB [Oscillospiraceae bacterium]
MPQNTPVIQNRKAYHEFFVLETIECGIELRGTEVKSLRQGRANLKDSWCAVDREVYVKAMHISPYEKGNRFNTDPMRSRRLLMHKREILRLSMEIKRQGLTLIPLKLYFVNGRAKLEVGLCKGKKLHDKRAVAAETESRRTIERAVKSMGE